MSNELTQLATMMTTMNNVTYWEIVSTAVGWYESGAFRIYAINGEVK